MWLVGPLTMTLQLPYLLDTNSVERGNCLLRNKNLVKNLSTNEMEWKGKPGDKWDHPSPVGKMMNLNKIMSLVKNLSTQLQKTGEENQTRESIDKKPPELEVEIWEENRKIIDIIDEKIF